MVKKNERKVQILELLEGNEMTAQEVNSSLGIDHAPRLLGYYHSQGILKRDETSAPGGGIQYRYELSSSGKDKLEYLK